MSRTASRLAVDDHFDQTLDPRWTLTRPNGGSIRCADSVLRLGFDIAVAGRYTDAQIDDYTGKRRRDFPWRPPLRMIVRARASHSFAPTIAPSLATPDTLRGTAGFGFWNYPFSLSGAVLRLPEAVWFFGASPPSNMALVPGSPGWGWKAQVVSARPGRFLASSLPTMAAIARARLTGDERPAARWVQHVSGASEAPLDAYDLGAWHTYTLDWLPHVAHFAVDGARVLTVDDPPCGTLGFVAWIDNQYAVATPRGEFGFGTLASGPQWLELDSLSITPL